MIDYSVRQYLLLFHLMIYKDAEADELASLFRVTKKTIATDFKIVRKLATQLGVFIESNQDCYHCKVIDSELFNRYFRSCYYFYHPNITLQDDSVLKNCYIGEMLINANSYITVDDIADTIGYSKSSLRNEIKYVRNFFSTYHIQVISTPYYGMKVQGKEFNLRMCLVNIRKQINYPSFLNLSENNENEIYIRFKQQVNQTMSTLRKKYRLVYNNYLNTKIIEYIVVQAERMQKNCYILSLPANYYRVRDQIEYTIAVELFQLLGIEPEHNREEEIISLTILLITYQDYYNQLKSRTLHQRYYDEAKPDLDNICQYLNNRWRITVERESVKDALFLEVLQLIFKSYYSMLSFEETSSNGVNRIDQNHPLIAKIVFSLLHNIVHNYGVDMNSTQIRNISSILHYALCLVKMGYHPQKCAIALYQNFGLSAILKDLLQTGSMKEYIGSVDIRKYTDFLNERLKDYDMVVTDQIIDVVPPNYYLLRDDEHHLDYQQLRSCLYPGIDHSQLDPARICVCNLMNVSMDEVLNEIIRMINESCTCDEAECNAIRNDYKVIGTYGKYLIVIVNASIKCENYLGIGKLPNAIKDNNSRVEYYCWLKFYPNEYKVRYYDILLSELIHCDELMEGLLNHPVASTIRTIVDPHLLP